MWQLLACEWLPLLAATAMGEMEVILVVAAEYPGLAGDGILWSGWLHGQQGVWGKDPERRFAKSLVM